MRKAITFLMSAAFVCVVVGCGRPGTGNILKEATAQEQMTKERETAGKQQPVSESLKSSNPSGESRVLIAYFSVPEDVDISGVDAVAGASIVVHGGEKLGNTEYVAGLIQKTIGGDLFRIETIENYPLDHDSLVDQAADE